MDNELEIKAEHLIEAQQQQLAEQARELSQYRAAVIALQSEIKRLRDTE